MTFNLLLIDDDEDIQLILTSILSQTTGVEVTSAPDGATALASLNHETFQGVILDHQLPDMTGDAILAHLLNTPGNPKPKVVMLSAEDRGEKVSSWIEAGASAVFKKPFNPIELVGKLRTIFGF